MKEFDWQFAETSQDLSFQGAWNVLQSYSAALNGSVVIANSLKMSYDKNILLVMGPSGSGKTTMLEQIGQMAIMNQMGCGVASTSATLPLFRKILIIRPPSSICTSFFQNAMANLKSILEDNLEDTLLLLDAVALGTNVLDAKAILITLLNTLATRKEAFYAFISSPEFALDESMLHKQVYVVNMNSEYNVEHVVMFYQFV